MNWFQRHLNLTALAIAIGSILIFLLLIWISFGFEQVRILKFIDLGFPVLLLLAIVTIIWLLLTVIGYGWVLYKKNHSPFFLLFFLPAFVVIIGCIVYKTFYFSNIDFVMDIVYGVSYEIAYRSYIPQIALPTVATFLIGWVVLLALNNRNKSIQTNDNQNIPTKVSRLNLLHGFYSANTKFRYTIIYGAVFVIIISIISCLFIHFGYLTYHLPGSVFSEFPEVSFEYPASHYEPIYYQFNYIHGENRTVMKFIEFRNALTHGISSEIRISCSNQTILDADAYKDSILEHYKNPDEYQRVEYVKIMVGDIPAYQLSISVEEVFSNKIDWNDFGTHVYVFFNHNGYSWDITWVSYKSETLQPPPFFTNLLETFKIE